MISRLKTRNINMDVFFPVEMNIAGKTAFAFTLPGLPLLLTGATDDIAWAFTGILIDRTNVETL